MIRPSAIKLPQTPFGRFRLLFLVFAVAGTVMAALSIAAGDASPPAKLGGIVLSFVLGAYWIFGYRRGRFPLVLELFEVYAIFVILYVAPGDPFLPLLGLLFRSCYGGFARAAARWVLWMGALLGAHSGRGDEQLEADLARAAAVALVPVMTQALLVALKASEIIQRRLNSFHAAGTSASFAMGLGAERRPAPPWWP